MRGRRRVISDINVTPLVDVMLVLLIIFMVTAPIMKKGIVMDLPRAKATSLRLRRPPVVISIKSGRIYVGRRRTSLEGMRILVRRIVQKRPDAQFVIEAERSTPFELVVKVLAELRDMGIERVGIATKPVRKRG